MEKCFYYSICIIFLLFGSCKHNSLQLDSKVSEDIRLNQIGFYPDGPKLAVIASEPETNTFYLVETESNKTVFSGTLEKGNSSVFPDRVTHLADFTAFDGEGKFALNVSGLGRSYPFVIGCRVFEDLGNGVLKAFYFQRASTNLSERYAGTWSRPAGHPDDEVRVHASAQSPERPEGTILSAPHGWYDAGDYNKYVVNSGITMGTLLSLYEDFPEYFSVQNLNIPESGSGVPDLLEEVMWNLKWMVQMQDPHDGGVYHKLTTAKFEGKVMPHEAINTRYVVAKSTAATLDFAAVMAQAARVYKDHYPDMAIKFLKAAETAWIWAKKNPGVFYEQNEMNKKYQPAIETGAYGNRQLADEWVWAAAELYISTHNLEYLDAVPFPENFELPNWGSVGWLGYYSLLRFRAELKNLPLDLEARIKRSLLQGAGIYINGLSSSGYRTVMGHQPTDFVWGSNAVAANQGIALLQAYLLSGEEKYLNNALGNLDYILGRNATAYSYVTGFGAKTPQNPHHRPSGAASDKPPLPGFVVGGSNPGQQDNCEYPSDIPDESYVDDYCSYASNEIAINWNAALAYLVNAIEAIKRRA